VSDSWDRVLDIVVVGSGAGALTAAIAAADRGATVEVLEKAALVGGTSAFSGGMPWVPCNSHMAEAGVEDSREEALEYLRGLTQGREPYKDWI
jgi:succinate dehydrogenase/fumarate reductase flavoprotein subunit